MQMHTKQIPTDIWIYGCIACVHIIRICLPLLMYKYVLTYIHLYVCIYVHVQTGWLDPIVWQFSTLLLQCHIICCCQPKNTQNWRVTVNNMLYAFLFTKVFAYPAHAVIMGYDRDGKMWRWNDSLSVGRHSLESGRLLAVKLQIHSVSRYLTGAICGD